jgi:NADH:ubiquinone oxidoreductase subunit 6 (subunit J)
MYEPFSLFTLIWRILVAAGIAAASYLFALSACDPGTPVLAQAWQWKLANGIALSLALLVFGAVIWRLVKGAPMRDEIDKAMRIDAD